MKVLFVGDIVGAPGRTAFARVVPDMKRSGKADLVVANAENVAGGKGLTAPLAEELFANGADVLTLGDHAWNRRELAGTIDMEPRILRPANFAPNCPGKGWLTLDADTGQSVTVVNLVGRVFMSNYDCPFRAIDAILARPAALGRVILVDFHAEATSEKVAMSRYLDGRVSALVGTHTHVQTSDEAVLPHGTAYLTDLGMTGPKDSIIGCEADPILQAFLTGMPARFHVASNTITLEGALVDVDEGTGRARGITRVRQNAD
ncbi:MAG: TIGR00282 family metallophosphoesterase [Kiritimatiellae bacterium]|nr:TIGR00282 family metallophosphoesterase [Kiritimatiellia bacterium]